MKTHPLPCARLFAAGLMSVALAVPAAGFNPVLDKLPGVTMVGAAIPSVRVTSPKQLLLTLHDPNVKGRVIVPANAQWDLSGSKRIPLRSGVSLIGERGALGSRPRLFTNYKAENYAFFLIEGNDVRVDGIHFQGPANGNRSSSQGGVAAIKIVQKVGETRHETPEEQGGVRVVITDCEFNEWTDSGVYLESTPSSRLRPHHAGLVRVDGNYFHHNARDDAG